MDRYCQERARRVLNDSAAAGTFLLNSEEPFRNGLGSCLSLERFSVSAYSVALRSSPAFSTASIQKRPRTASASQLQRMKRLIVVPSGLRWGTCRLFDGSVWPGGSGRRIPLTVRSPTSEDQYCEAFSGRVRCGVAVRSHAGADQPFA
jgi:hypothetical protein